MPRIFISHSSKDASFAVNELKPALEKAGMSVWCSSADLHYGIDWEKELLKELSLSDWIVVILSQEAVDSDWVRAEVHWAMEKRKGRVVPIMLCHCDPASVHLRLGTIQFIDFRHDREAAITELIGLIRGGAVCAPAAASNSTVIIPRDALQDRRLRVLFRVSLGAEREMDVPLEIDRQCSIGRAADVDFPVADNSVSRKHARFDVVLDQDGKHLEITDLQSSNGTFVNQTRIHAAHRVMAGDVIDLGAAKIFVRQID